MVMHLLGPSSCMNGTRWNMGRCLVFAKSVASTLGPFIVLVISPSVQSFPGALLPPASRQFSPGLNRRGTHEPRRTFRCEIVSAVPSSGSDDVEESPQDLDVTLEFSSGGSFVAPFSSSAPVTAGKVNLDRRVGSSGLDGGNAQDASQADLLRSTLRRLAELSLEDYEWRSGLFKSNQADRLVEASIARMRGQDPSYVRPMDAVAEKLGPLGRWERAAVDWLSSVFEEEGRRARNIVSQDGQLVRPIEGQVLGPLGFLEKAVVDFLNSIRASEKERVRTSTLRPKDLKEKRGPLGELEQEAVRILKQIEESEAIRAQQIRSRGGEIVRPIDVPGPLGEFEMAVSELFQAEKLRSSERKAGGKVVRPKDARYRGPLGDAEYQAYEAIKQLNQEEMNRLESIQQYMMENRPMETNRDSLWGVLEAIVVGLLRAPQLFASVLSRVLELLSSQPMSDDDKSFLRKIRTSEPPPNSEESGA